MTQAYSTKTTATTQLHANKQTTSLFPTTGKDVHVLITCGGGAYQGFQMRVMYATFKIAQRQPGGASMVAFTRILHRVHPDALMDEIPTFHAMPLQPACDDWCEFPPASRPDAVRQFFDAAKKDSTLIKAPWLFMTEPDYVWMKPIEAPKAESSEPALAFPFNYIIPSIPEVAKQMIKFYKRSASEIPGTGPAPALMRVDEWLRIVPEWERVTAEIEADEDARKVLGWVREMYAFSIACALQKLRVRLDAPPKSTLIAQPPADATLGAAPIAHYTWGAIITDAKDAPVWKFEKREYVDEKWMVKPEVLPEIPRYDGKAGWKLQDGAPVGKELRDTLDAMIKRMNEGIKTLKPLST